MASKITNFGRFYIAIRDCCPGEDREEFKKMMVRQFTHGRTESLREMTVGEYNRCCREIERINGDDAALKNERHKTLNLMQQHGVDTTDWSEVDKFCMGRRIIGKRFSQITLREHDKVQKRIRMILKKENERPAKASGTQAAKVVPIIITPGKLAGEA